MNPIQAAATRGIKRTTGPASMKPGGGSLDVSIPPPSAGAPAMGSPQPNPSPAENGSGLVAVSASQDFEVAPAQPKLDVGIRYGGCCGIHPVSNKMFWFYHPEGAFRKIWDGIQSVLLIYIAVAVPGPVREGGPAFHILLPSVATVALSVRRWAASGGQSGWGLTSRRSSAHSPG